MKTYLSLAFVLSLTLLLPTLINTQPQDIDPGMQHLNQFQTAMSTMLATQRFTFDLAPGQQEKISLWPQPDIQKVVIAFYTHNQNDPGLVTGQGFFASCQVNRARTNFFEHQKLGVCIIQIRERPNFIDLTFLSEETPLTVYMQYEFKKMKVETRPNEVVTQNVPTEQQENRYKLSEISGRFEKVKNSTQITQGALRLLTKSLNKHSTRFEKNMKYAQHRLVIETAIVVLSGLLGLWIIRKQLNSGYELLV